MSDQWIVVRTPSGWHCYEVGGVDHQALMDRLAQIRRSLGVPGDIDPEDASMWDVQVVDGPPHPKLLSVALNVDRLPAENNRPATAAEPAPALPHELHEAARHARARLEGTR